ncbi:unnamed protein product, partial [Allacma fusca]
MVIKFLVVQET